MCVSGTRMAYADILEATGFYHSGRPLPSATYSAEELLPSAWGQGATPGDAAERIDRYFKYEAIVRPEGEGGKLGATDVFELSGAPCIYFKRLDDELGAEELTHDLLRWQRAAWNHGRAPMLWIVTPTQVRILNAYARPSPDGTGDSEYELKLFDDIANQLDELRQFLSRDALQSGEFWRGPGSALDRKSRVDAQLVRDVGEAAQRLSEEDLPLAEAHRLLLRGIFARYLEERDWIPPHVLAGLGVSSFTDALSDVGTATGLFDWLARTFNGDVFPARESVTYTRAQLAELKFILEGHRPSTGQMSLWPYQFDVIPIELLSSIYETFAHALDPVKARAQSTHYTPVNLVDLTLSEVFRDTHFSGELPLDAKVLDLSCGSGVFLAECLRRLVGRQIASGRDRTRELVRGTLYDQLFGVDVNPGAVQIAAVSLYLAALELDPHPGGDGSMTFEPLVRPEGEEEGARKRAYYNLCVADAFVEPAPLWSQPPFRERDFSVVVGNPPWTRPEGGKRGLPDDSGKRQLASHMCYAQRKHIQLPYQNPPDQAFVWRGADFALPAARFGMILDARRFSSHRPESVAARRALLQRFGPRVLINLSDMSRDRVFPDAIEPALILIAQNRETSHGDTLVLAAPQRSRTYSKHGVLDIGPEQVKTLPARLLVEDEDLLRLASWGTWRDHALIRYVRRLGSLESALTTIGTQLRQGFIRGGSDRYPVDAKLVEGRTRCLEKAGFCAFVLDPRPLKLITDTHMHRPYSAERYCAPLLLVRMGIGARGIEATMSDVDVFYSQRYYGIGVPPRYGDWAKCLSGILNSSLATYFAFLTAAEWGVERDHVIGDDLRRLPVPPAQPHLGDDAARVAATTAELEGLAVAGAIGEDAYRKLDIAVYDLYRLDQTQRVLIEDMVANTVDLQRNGFASRAAKPPLPGDLELYAQQFASVFDECLGVDGRREVAAEVFEIPAESPLRVVRFMMVGQSAGVPNLTTVQHQDLAEALASIAASLSEGQYAGLHTRRHMRIYGPGAVHIVKPAQRRFWTRAAAMADADSVLAEELGVQPR